MEDEGAYAGEEQRGAHIEAGDERNEDGGSKHGKQVLYAEHHKFRFSQLSGIVYALAVCVHCVMVFLF